MSSEKRLLLFILLTLVSFQAVSYVMEATGLVPPPSKKPPAVAKAKDQEKEKDKDKEKAKAAATDLAKTKTKPDSAPRDQAKKVEVKANEPAVPLAEPSELVLGSTKRAGLKGYHLEVRLDQRGAGVASVGSALYEAEFVATKPKHRPLELLQNDPLAPTSLALTLIIPRLPGELAAETDEEAKVADPSLGEIPLDGVVWEVVRAADGKAVRAVNRPGLDQAKRANSPGQELVFRTKVDPLGVVLTKTYRLYPGEDGFEMALTLESPGKDQSVVYKILGPHGIPIEGEWYTGTFRDAVFGMAKGSSTEVVTLSADAIAKQKDKPELFQAQPLKYAGVENQYFASLMVLSPPPTGPSDRRDQETRPVVLHLNPDERQKADIGIEITSKPVLVGPNVAVTHAFRVFAGPKTLDALTPFGAEDVAFRKTSWIPGAIELARWVITPLLGVMYDVTVWFSRLFGGTRGNYGVAIILLTLSVRMMMFPLGRKQALAAKRMQDLQPLMKEIQVKFKDDKEQLTKEQFALYKRHGVNPVGGCLPALIQLPIFVGLWQALNNSVSLRHASFLYIDNLAAPDMLFKFPWSGGLPFLGDYFNLLPFGVVTLMLIQTKLFSPPATTPEAEAQQNMMKYMMVFMAFMFYKVPSGLGLYFITSSSWQIGERLLLPKVTPPVHAPVVVADDGKGNGGGGGAGRGGNGKPPEKPPGRIAKFWEKILQEAQKNPTYRNLTDEKDRDDRRKPRAKPGRRR